MVLQSAIHIVKAESELKVIRMGVFLQLAIHIAKVETIVKNIVKIRTICNPQFCVSERKKWKSNYK